MALSALDRLGLDAEALIGLLDPEHQVTVIDHAPKLAESIHRGGPLLEVAFRMSFHERLGPVEAGALALSPQEAGGLALNDDR